MKKIAIMSIWCGLAALILGGCAVPVGEDFITPRETEQNGTYVVDYNLQTYIPVPVIGEPAVKSVINRGDLKASVTWKSEAGVEVSTLETFEANTVYQAEIKLTPREGYLFNPSIAFEYQPGKTQKQEEIREDENSTRTVRVTYRNSNDGNIVTDYNLQNYVPFPLVGKKPVWTIDTDEVTGTVFWKEIDGSSSTDLDDSSIFQAGKTYTADIVLQVRPGGYRFDKEKDFKYPEDTVITQPESNRELEERLLTPVTYQTPKTPVNLFNLTNYITAPVKDARPVTAGFTTHPQYTAVEVVWTPNDPAFIEGHPYTATVVLTALEGYGFPQVTPFYYEGSGAWEGAWVKPRNNNGVSVTADVIFPENSRLTVIIDGQY
ncbi:hypothetical protein LQZ21_11135 [Treponema sp. TIM-1]|uniref:hypothetical protein n=1 Tax=Treponema sp. TIM-1 TaxID=2898417 RepID=UPI00397EEB0C